MKPPLAAENPFKPIRYTRSACKEYWPPPRITIAADQSSKWEVAPPRNFDIPRGAPLLSGVPSWAMAREKRDHSLFYSLSLSLTLFFLSPKRREIFREVHWLPGRVYLHPFECLLVEWCMGWRWFFGKSLFLFTMLGRSWMRISIGNVVYQAIFCNYLKYYFLKLSETCYVK